MVLRLEQPSSSPNVHVHAPAPNYHSRFVHRVTPATVSWFAHQLETITAPVVVNRSSCLDSIADVVVREDRTFIAAGRPRYSEELLCYRQPWGDDVPVTVAAAPQKALPENALPTGPVCALDLQQPDENAGYSYAPIRIRLAKEISLSVNYTLNDATFTIEPGTAQSFLEDRDWTVRFNRGGTFGDDARSLKAGVYEFACDAETGWRLERVEENDVASR